MQIFVKSIVLLFFILPFNGQAKELTLTGSGGFELKLDYYQPQQASTRAVLLLHQCNSSRLMYKDIAKELSARNIHALSLDFRWFGESVDEKTNLKALAKAPKKEGKSPWATVMEFWPQDVQLTYDHLRKKVGKNGEIGVIGASCGGRQAQVLSESRAVKAIGFFSSGVLNKNNKKSIAEYKAKFSLLPSLFIAAEKDGTYSGMQKAFSLNENKKSKFISYKGEMHGHPLLTLDEYLARSIANWFDSNLAN